MHAGRVIVSQGKCEGMSNLTMSNQEVTKYFSDHKYATLMIYGATADYTAARCCILNGLFRGFMLASEAIEKLLKALIYLESGEEMKSGHNVFALKEKLKQSRDYGLDRYDDQLNKLYDHYQSRYHDNPVTGKGATSAEFPVIDNLWLELIEKLPVPDEVKYQTAFFSQLADPNPFWRNDHWLRFENQALAPKFDSIKAKYLEIKRHLYPTN
jgi:HEPN domain